MHSQRNRPSPQVPNRPWAGPAGLTIAQMVALLLTGALWWGLGLLPIGHSFLAMAARGLVTGLVGGLAAVGFYALADSSREPILRQNAGYLLRRHVYSNPQKGEGPGHDDK